MNNAAWSRALKFNAVVVFQISGVADTPRGYRGGLPLARPAWRHVAASRSDTKETKSLKISLGQQFLCVS